MIETLTILIMVKNFFKKMQSAKMNREDEKNNRIYLIQILNQILKGRKKSKEQKSALGNIKLLY